MNFGKIVVFLRHDVENEKIHTDDAADCLGDGGLGAGGGEP